MELDGTAEEDDIESKDAPAIDPEELPQAAMVKAEWEDEEQVDDEIGLLVKSGESAATRGGEPISNPLGGLECAETGETMACCRSGSGAVEI